MLSRGAYPSDLFESLVSFSNDAQAKLDEFVAPLNQASPPELIFHYTNDVGLRGILESGQLWLTDIFGLNDPSELDHGVRSTVEFLDEKAAGAPPEAKLFAERFASIRTQRGLQRSAHYFVCSFSAHPYHLRQWITYADNGRGFALAFSCAILENCFTAAEKITNSTFPITYSDHKLIDMSRTFVEGAFPLISSPHGKGMTSSEIDSYMQDLSTRLALAAIQTAILFKHEAYKDEREYRFLQVFRGDQPAPGVKVRSRPYSLVRYRAFDWRHAAPQALTKIILGPAADAKAEQFANDCLAHFFPGADVKVTRSELPYRVA